MVTTQDADFYSSLGSNYETAFGHDSGLVNFVHKILAHLPPRASVLDIGCGTGKPVASTLAEAGCSVTGIDISGVMVELSRKAVPDGKFEVADMLQYEPPEGTQFDAVLSLLSLFALERKDIEKMAKNWSRWVPAGGILSVGSVAAEDCKPMVQDHHYDKDGLCARGIPFRFMGNDITLDLFTRIGWETILSQNGFEIIDTATDLFTPPRESQCDEEMHYFILARKIAA
ncbi:hypothetical protein TWF730_009082 [Orbilia blumenaviensis]|uniref:phosphoethanolamine N-methyltransferase n=1 Tax=Orbilia blumenaviensis TaxID=1796055 RepID=A0AAV9UXA5_9PEZI